MQKLYKMCLTLLGIVNNAINFYKAKENNFLDKVIAWYTSSLTDKLSEEKAEQDLKRIKKILKMGVYSTFIYRKKRAVNF